MILCKKCGAFCHDDCIGSAELCLTCLIRWPIHICGQSLASLAKIYLCNYPLAYEVNALNAIDSIQCDAY